MLAFLAQPRYNSLKINVKKWVQKHGTFERLATPNGGFACFSYYLCHV